MAIIAMTREMGSLGKDIALGLSEELGLRLIQHEVVDHVANRMQLGSSAVNRFLEGKAGLLERWGIDEKSVSYHTADEIFEIASHDNVLIRGWGATYLLFPVVHVLCVRVCAPMQARVQVMMARLGLDDEHIARREIEMNDAAHSKAMAHLLHADWTNPLSYDLVINTAHVPTDTGVDIIKRLVSSPAFQPTEESRRKLEELKLNARIRAALKANPKTRTLDRLFEVTLSPDVGAVTVSGMVENDDLSAEAVRTVAAVPGVETVENKLLVATRMRYGP